MKYSLSPNLNRRGGTRNGPGGQNDPLDEAMRKLSEERQREKRNALTSSRPSEWNRNDELEPPDLSYLHSDDEEPEISDEMIRQGWYADERNEGWRHPDDGKRHFQKRAEEPRSTPIQVDPIDWIRKGGENRDGEVSPRSGVDRGWWGSLSGWGPVRMPDVPGAWNGRDLDPGFTISGNESLDPGFLIPGDRIPVPNFGAEDGRKYAYGQTPKVELLPARPGEVEITQLPFRRTAPNGKGSEYITLPDRRTSQEDEENWNIPLVKGMPDMTPTLMKATTAASAGTTNYSQTVDHGTETLYNTGKQQEIIQTSGVSGGSDIPVKASNESQGNEVIWNEEDRSITIISPTGSFVILNENEDFKIGPDGKAYYLNKWYNAVIGLNLYKGNRVELVKGAPGKSRIILNGDTANPLLEGRDYYIGADGIPYYYGSVRMLDEALGNEVKWIEGAEPGKSKIVLDKDWGHALKEGEDYYIAPDGKAYYFGQAAPTWTSGTAVGGNTSVEKTVYYSQNDPEWKNYPYTVVPGSGATISSSGCGPTCAAMVVSTLTGITVTPAEMGDFAIEKGYRTKDKGTYGYGLFLAAGEEYGFSVEKTTDINKALTALTSGNAMVIVSVTGPNNDSNASSRGYFTGGSHFMVIVGVNDANGYTVVTILDPNAGNPHYNKYGDNAVTVLKSGEIQVGADLLEGEAVNFYICVPNQGT